jgi:methylenetetrahydrofolate dehydrogenase (NADP+)/methenyltetrahydrofolate cyclohydrolase
MILIDGRKVSDSLKEKIKQEIISLKNRYNKVPGLVVILVGDNPASKAYVVSKSKTCVELGMHSEKVELPENTSEEELLSLISKYNDDENIDGILVQLPLPKHIDETKVIDAINPAKDVDGFHPINVGNLVLGRECFVPCTPAGIIELLKYYNIETSGKHAVVIGRSSIVGKPMANLLMQKNAYANCIVTVCHSAAKEISVYTKEADILIAAIGSANFVKSHMVKEGAVVIDVGINRIDDALSPKGYKIVGDVDFENVKDKCAHITPVPGGVGPMTIAMLMQNALKSFKKKLNAI